MFSNVKKNNVFYIIDKLDVPILKIGKVVDISGVNYTNPLMHTIKIVVNTDDCTYKFEELPANLSIANDDSLNVIVSDNKDDMIKAVDNMLVNSQQILDSVDYHTAVIEKCEDILIQLNPKVAKEKEQEEKINNLEAKITGIETNILGMKDMISQLLNK